MFYDNKIIRFINKNKGMLVIVVAIIIFLLLIIQVLNKASLENVKDNTDPDRNLSNEVKKSKDTILSDTKIKNNTTAEENYNLIATFIQYCNNHETQQAYNLLTEECKENLYPRLENFEKNYVYMMFQEKRQADIQSWTGNSNQYTYLVKLTGDIMATGNTKAQEYEDYITVEREKQKLNINRYIGRQKIEKTQEIENLNFEVNFVDRYKDYEIYDLKVSNPTNQEVILDDLESTTSTYIETNKETKISCLNYEVGISSFYLDVGIAKTMKLRFMKQYNTNIVDEKLVFSSAILDAEKKEDKKSIAIEL